MIFDVGFQISIFGIGKRIFSVNDDIQFKKISRYNARVKAAVLLLAFPNNARVDTVML